MSRMFGYRVIGLGSGGDGGANRSTRVTINLDIESTTQNYNIYSNRGGTYVAGKSDVTLTVDASQVLLAQVVMPQTQVTNGHQVIQLRLLTIVKLQVLVEQVVMVLLV